MKTSARNIKSMLLLIAVLSLTGYTARSQNSIEGKWEGTFMGDFRTVVHLTAQQGSGYTGKILMYSNSSMIQDDPLSRITLEGNEFTFYIEAKQTGFTGRLNEDGTEITGHFIFPDESQHPLTVRKTDPEQGENARSSADLMQLKNFGYETADLISDLQFLVQQLKAYHPQPYRYTTEDDFRKAAEDLGSELTSGENLEEYFIRIATLLEKVHCSHTGARLPREYQQLLQESGNFFPLRLFITEERAYYISGYSGPGGELIPGSEILSINGVQMHDIVDRIYSMIPSEGMCLSTKSYEINLRFHSYFNLLDDAERFEVAFSSNGSAGSITLAACRYNDLNITEEPAGSEESVEFVLNKDLDAAIMRIPSFAIRDMEGYMQQLEGIFRDLGERNVKNLVVDLRGNGGGHPIFAAQLLSYLTDRPFTYFKRNPEVSDFEPLYNPMQPDALYFSGKVYVLVDGGCLSTTGHLIALLKAHTRAVFIGEEPGSSYTCNDFSMQLTLPRTGIEVNIPRTTFEVAAENTLKGVRFRVDYPVVPDISQVINGTDAPLSLAYTLITGIASP